MSAYMLVSVLTKPMNLSSLDARRLGLLYCAALYLLSSEFLQWFVCLFSCQREMNQPSTGIRVTSCPGVLCSLSAADAGFAGANYWWILFVIAPMPRSEPLLRFSCVFGFGDPGKEALFWLCVSEGSRQKEHSTANTALQRWSWQPQPCADQNVVSSVKKYDSAYETNHYTGRVGLEDCVDKSWETILPGNHCMCYYILTLIWAERSGIPACLWNFQSLDNSL